MFPWKWCNFSMKISVGNSWYLHVCTHTLPGSFSQPLKYTIPRASKSINLSTDLVNWKISTEISENSVHLGRIFRHNLSLSITFNCRCTISGHCWSTGGQHADRRVKLAGLDCSSTVWASDFHNLVQPTKSHNECGRKLMDTESSAYTTTHFLWYHSPHPWPSYLYH